jgi:protein-disulfide isomerase
MPQDSTLGSAVARAAIIEFSDFQCPFCAEFVNKTLPLLKDRYVATGLLRVSFRHLPLPVHDRATAAAETAACAATHGAFWQIHDALFASPAHLDDAGLRQYAALAGVSSAELKQCQNIGAARVRADLDLAKSLGVTGTPVFFVGRIVGTDSLEATAVIVGARPFDQFDREIRLALTPA